MDSSQSTRPASQLIAGFASPSTPAGGRRSIRQSLRSVPPAVPAQPVHGQSSSSPVKGNDCVRKLTANLDTEKEELRVQVSTLRYELENVKQERELEVLRHEKETRDLQSRADADFRKAQVSYVK